MKLLLAIIVGSALTASLLAQDKPGEKVIQAVVRREPWKGWGNGEPVPADLKSKQEPEKFQIYPTPAGEAAHFSGKIEGIDKPATAEVGIVSMIGVQWTKKENYQWSKVNADGTFDTIAKTNPQARRALVVRAPGHPWTFLRKEFEANESAKEIVLRVPASKRVLLTIEDSNAERVKSFMSEVFYPFEVQDDAGKQLKAQRYDSFRTTSGELEIDLPLTPMALLISGSGIAPYYQIIDPREAERFHFIMLVPGKVAGVVKKNGQPVADQELMVVNEAAPLSATRRKTDKSGHFEAPNRVPGTDVIYVNHQQVKEVEVKEGKTSQVEIELKDAPATQDAR